MPRSMSVCEEATFIYEPDVHECGWFVSRFNSVHDHTGSETHVAQRDATLRGVGGARRRLRDPEPLLSGCFRPKPLQALCFR